ncbi:hypothetical protein SAMN04487906_0271 [Zhouia amylolytica]|uniref:Uncharacterized protein n=2 Tax=Zhouia amylolytica TaxID=376730 RepID=W2ULE3_9FLAO|nr:hypothetical protein [Zhouia amylolytica]ETN94246.1 hypothetical protein P278_30500 [Zhouia amylolytica AD3]MCQ0111457.1 hypothetical protein [Zhouia amylolytica]SFS38972.1 hypothetical protein SAMN04487906_0271 [Zhouia amylolytica]
MKILISILILLAVALIAYNVTLIDFSEPFKGDSVVAIIGVVASICAILLLTIFTLSKKIQDKIKDNH